MMDVLMRRPPLATLAFAVLVSFPVVGPAVAAEPVPGNSAGLASALPSSEVSPSVTPSPTPDASPDPTATASAPGPTAAPGATAGLPGPSSTPATAGPHPITSKPSPPQTKADGRPDPTGRYIVVLRSGADVQNIEARHGAREGLKVNRSFGRAIRGFTAKLDQAQRRALLADPNVVGLVPDEVIQLAAQTVPTGVSRIGTRTSAMAQIDGVDQRVDADVAIIDTGIYQHPDLNVAGGYNCSSSNRGLWRDMEGHGTHVAGTVAAIDNSFGVVGVAPGARVWAVKILNDSGYGLLSWYVCGLDWVLSQRDPANPSRPLFEVANMSVAKYGRDDGRCGASNKDILHQAICRVVAGGITVVAAAGNDHASAAARVPAAYNEVITVSALADTDGRSGGTGGNRCYSWGGYDKDDTFADFSNYGSDVDLIAPGKCIWSTKPGPTYGYSSGTSMAAPAVTGAVALYMATRPAATPAEVRANLRYLGNLNWKTWTDPDRTHEPLLDVSRIATLGTFGFATPRARPPVGEAGGTARIPVVLTRSPSFFERVYLRVSNVPSGWSASLSASSLMGWSARATELRVTVPPRTHAGTYTLRITGSNWGRTATTDLSITVVNDLPTASPPIVAPNLRSGVTMDGSGVPTSTAMRVAWPAATDKSSGIAGYEVEHRVNGGSWTAPGRRRRGRGPSSSTGWTWRRAKGFGSAPATPPATGAPGSRWAPTSRSRASTTARHRSRIAGAGPLLDDERHEPLADHEPPSLVDGALHVHRPRHRRRGPARPRPRQDPHLPRRRVSRDRGHVPQPLPAPPDGVREGVRLDRYPHDRPPGRGHVRPAGLLPGRIHRPPLIRSDSRGVRNAPRRGRSVDRLAQVRYRDRPDAPGRVFPWAGGTGRGHAVARAMWKGAIQFGLVTIPIKLYLATESKGISFNMLHKDDLSRIQMKIWCPVEDEPISRSDTVKGYEYSPGEYVVITDEDLERVPLKTVRSIEIEQFTKAERDDSNTRFVKSAYYVEPDKIGRKAFYLLKSVLEEDGLTAICKVVIKDREALSALDPFGDTMLLTTLHWPDEIRSTAELDLPDERFEFKPAELTMAKQLVSAMTGEFDATQYKDEYRQALEGVIQAKVEGKETVEIEEPEETGKLIDLMAALEASVSAAKAARTAGSEKPVSVAEAREAKEAKAEKAAKAETETASKRKPAAKAAAAHEAPAKTARKRKSA